MNLLQVLSYFRHQQEFKQEIKGYVSNEELYFKLVMVLIKKFSKCLKNSWILGVDSSPLLNIEMKFIKYPVNISNFLLPGLTNNFYLCRLLSRLA